MQKLKLKFVAGAFINAGKNVSVFNQRNGDVRVATAKNNYTLVKHPTLNYHIGVANGHKVHFAHKVQVATLSWW